MVDPLRAAREAAREIGAALRAAAAQVQAAIREFALAACRAIARVLAAIRDLAYSVWRAVVDVVSFCVDVVVGFARWFCRQVATVYNLAVGLVADVLVFLRVFAPTIVAIGVWWFWRRWELLLFAGMWIVTILVALAVYGPRARPENAPPRPRWAVIAGHVIVIALLLASQVRYAGRYVVPIIASWSRAPVSLPAMDPRDAPDRVQTRASAPASARWRPGPGARVGDRKTNPKDGAVAMWVPAGEFIMGSDDVESSARPRRTVQLDGFWMYRTEVTVAQYRRFCNATGRDMPDAPSWGWKEDHPIVNVSWDDAKAYADWAGVTLPTEAQWEKAARGTDGREYPWGNEFDSSKAVWLVHPRAERSTAPVGSIPSGASPYGCLDMSGNVWEWCADWRDKNKDARCLRGGSWHRGYPGYFRCAYRHGFDHYPGDRYGYGFRCARTD